MAIWFTRLIILSVCFPFAVSAQSVKILTNQIGYESAKSKHAVIVSDKRQEFKNFSLIDAETGKNVYTGKVIDGGPVDKWKNWSFSTIDFSGFNNDGTFRLQVSLPGNTISSYPFIIGKNVLEQAILSDLIYYFKGQRSSGLLDAADHHLLFAGKVKDSIDAHGGWYDATGDYGKHLSHLSFSSYFNPQQISLTVWTLYKNT
ncbi:MAG: glycoside hydrolase family 9 protein [Bacteroidota bacterium]